MIRLILLASFIPFVLSSCSSDFNDSISLEGTWTSCYQVAYTKSRKVTITINQNKIDQTISDYSSNAICENTPSSQVFLTGTIFFEQLGESPFNDGGTNVTITFTNIDYYNCGLGDPAYTYWRIPNNLGFWQASNEPSCDENDRGSGITYFFQKIN